jgi:hypothetical protein
MTEFILGVISGSVCTAVLTNVFYKRFAAKAKRDLSEIEKIITDLVKNKQ